MGENEKIMELLNTYEKTSRQKINRLKTSMPFNKNVIAKNQ